MRRPDAGAANDPAILASSQAREHHPALRQDERSLTARIGAGGLPRIHDGPADFSRVLAYLGDGVRSGRLETTALIRLILNVLWLIFGGWISGLLWLLGGAILALTVVGLPWTFAAWRIASYSFWPFGREVVWRDEFSGQEDLGTGCMGIGLNVIWFVFAGWYIALSHLVIAFAEAITIIGIPFALKDLELAKLALAPVGRTIRDKP